MDAESIQRRFVGLFPDLLGLRLIEASAELVVGELSGRDELCTVPGVMHGGALMAFADTLGAVGTVLNLPPGATTVTLESKTNFLGAGKASATLRGECVPLHRGARTMVWQTKILDGERLIAFVTQTQIVIAPTTSSKGPASR